MKPSEAIDDPKTFSERVRSARKRAGLSQEALARLVSGDETSTNSLIDRMENRNQDGSKFVVQIAKHCKVSPMWLATGEGERSLDRKSMSDAAALIGVAWDYLRAPHRDRIAWELLETALPAVPKDHSMRKAMERLHRDVLTRQRLREQTLPSEPALAKSKA